MMDCDIATHDLEAAHSFHESLPHSSDGWLMRAESNLRGRSNINHAIKTTPSIETGGWPYDNDMMVHIHEPYKTSCRYCAVVMMSPIPKGSTPNRTRNKNQEDANAEDRNKKGAVININQLCSVMHNSVRLQQGKKKKKPKPQHPDNYTPGKSQEKRYRENVSCNIYPVTSMNASQ
jgi:hypothetical protein